ncbi:MAG: hypothetical protein QM621_11370 [Aeromicrobium sp.]|uniref:SCO7613 C-terminal domain-containing membrane protein n=1 Tax=Aeromicrobium sp. TaxID=1871063 RepID=UPI0039E544D2
MRYADASRCPNCRASLTGQPRCFGCGLNLAAEQLPEVWEHFTEIDRLLEIVRGEEPTPQPAAPAPDLVPDPAPALPPPKPVAPPPVPSSPPVPPLVAARPQSPTLPTCPPAGGQLPPRSAPPEAAATSGGGLTVGSVLLGLGAILLVVAGVVFLSYAWNVVGLGGRVAIMAAATLAVGALGAWVTSRRLRGSAEAVWLVFACFVTADWFAAVELGLLGMDGLPDWLVVGVWWLLTTATTVAVGAAAHRLLDRRIVTTQVLAGFSAIWFGGALGDALHDVGARVFWAALIVGLLLAAVTACAHMVEQKVWAAVSAAGTGLAALTAFGAALVEAVAHPSFDEYAGEAHGLPLLVLVVIAAGVSVWRPAREAAVATGLLLFTLLIALPLGEPLDGQAWHLWIAVVLPTLAAARIAPRVREFGAGVGTLVATVVVGLLIAVGWLTGLAMMAASMGEAAARAGEPSFLVSTASTADMAGPSWWATLAGGLALAVSVALVGRWPEAEKLPDRQFLATAATVAAATVVASLSALGTPVVILSLAVLASGLGLAVAAVRWCGRGWEPVGHLIVGSAPVFAVLTRDGMIVMALVTALCLLFLAVAASWREAAFLPAGLSAVWTLVATGLAAGHPGIGLDAGPAVGLVVLVSLILSVAGLMAAGPPLSWTPGLAVEVVGAAGTAIALLVGIGLADGSWVSAWLAAVGATLVAVGLLVERRAWARYVGPVFLVLAWIVFLADATTTVVEAYTLPFAAALLAAGGVAMARSDRWRTWAALGPGLVLGAVPSAFLAYADPLSLRALLVGLAAAALVGVGLALKWQAPFTLGGVVLAILAIVEIAPYGWGLPRWILLGLAGLLLLGAGITWEDRVRDGRAAARFVRAMR